MKTIYWLGSILVVATVGAWAFLASASTGDAIVVARLPQVQLTSGQRTKFAAAVTAACPSVSPAAMQRFYCIRSIDDSDDARKLDVRCAAEFSATLSDAEWLDAVLAGQLDPNASGDVPKRLDCGTLSDSAKATLRTAVVDAYPAADVSTILDVDVRRDGVGNTAIHANASYVKTLSPTAARVGVLDGSVVRVLGKVQ